MKTLFSTILFAALLAPLAHAEYDPSCRRGHDSQGNCEDDNYVTCSVRDGRGRLFSASTMPGLDSTWAQIRAMKQCRGASSVPRTCKPLGCHQTPL